MDVRQLAGQVVVVTGAGRGLGRAHALVLAKAGATIVVNDVGAGIDGAGRDESIAELVVDEICSTGGRAVADTTDIASIGGGRALVERTVRELGRVDAVINNAGFASGGGTIGAPNSAEIDALLAVHLGAALGTMSAAFEHMRERGGRIVNTVSEAALDPRYVGGLGYGIAKASLWSATLCAAMAGREVGISVNGISPGARTRLNESILDADFREGASSTLDLAPEHVSRVVLYLLGPDGGDINGKIIHAAAGVVREYTTRRVSDSELVNRLTAAMRTP